MSRQSSLPNRQELSRTTLEKLSSLAVKPEAQRRNVENWVVATLRSYHVVVDLYCSDPITKKAKVKGIRAATKHVDALLNAPNWLVPEMHGFELMALSDRPMRGQRTERAFRAADDRIKKEQVALARIAKRLRLMRAAIEARPSTVLEALAEKTAAKPHTAWLAHVIVSFWMKVHPEDGFRDEKLVSLHAFAQRLWMVADDMKELAADTVRTRLKKAIDDVKHISLPEVVPEGGGPVTRRGWRDTYVDRAKQLGVDEESAAEMVALRQFELTDDAVAAADHDVAALNAEID